MKRWLLILLMWVLPLQLSFAAVAPYCAHEEGAAAQHFGHHSHKHQDGDSHDKHQSKLPGDDPDCDYCHHASGAALAMLPPAALTELLTTHLEAPPGDFDSFIPDLIPPPDRACLG